MKKESRYYKAISKWINEYLGYYVGGDVTEIKTGKERTYINTGMKKLSGDVFGIKFTGNEVTSDVEICCVEVKDTKKITMNDINQARGYGIFADKVYLATKAPLDDEMRGFLNHFGVGYFQIKSERSIVLLETPSKQNVILSEKIKLLDKLWIGHCTICQCFFPKWDYWQDGDTYYEDEGKKSYKELRRSRAIFNEGINYSPILKGKDSPYKNNQVVTRYVCAKCVEDFEIE